jgi:hydroxymethylpyrimidine pyrophosphatase-like HAD family hydrolase
MIIRPDLTVIEEHLMDATTAASVIAIVEAEGVDVWLYQGADWFVKNGGAPHVLHEKTNVGFEPTIVSELNTSSGAVKIVAVSDDPERLARCARAIESKLPGRVAAQLSQSYYLDITHPKANKGEVVRSLSRILSIRGNRFATLGDMPNDISMFKESGLSIAMGNASLEVNTAADYETKRNDNEGFAFAVESIILPIHLNHQTQRKDSA